MTESSSADPKAKRQKLTDVRLLLETKDGDKTTTYDASKYKLAEASTVLEDVFSQHADHKQYRIEITEGYDTAAVALLDFLHTQFGDSSSLKDRDFAFLLKVAKVAQQLRVNHAALDQLLRRSPATIEEGMTLANAYPFMATRASTIQHLVKRATYSEIYASCTSLDQLKRLCDAAEMKRHHRSTHLLKWLADHPDSAADIDINVRALSGTYIRGVLLGYALKYPHIAKRFGNDLLDHVMAHKADEGDVSERATCGMIWGIPLLKTGARKLAVDLAWLGLDTLVWKSDKLRLYTNPRDNRPHLPTRLPLTFDSRDIGFTD